MIKLGLPIVVLVVVLDQLTKWFARDALWEPPSRIEVFSFFDLVAVENRGISFGMLESVSGFGPWLIAGIALAIAVALVVWLTRTRRRLPAIALGLIVGGALGNVIDRARLGWVIDFIDLHAGDYHWPAFNIADAGITIGVGLLLIDALFCPSRPAK
ncbi:MAG: signal peptidase II [Alphaproteobacteria bacterium]|nr:signal peptidase II [Alphaproteobacteria bacterium]